MPRSSCLFVPSLSGCSVRGKKSIDSPVISFLSYEASSGVCPFVYINASKTTLPSVGSGDGSASITSAPSCISVIMWLCSMNPPIIVLLMRSISCAVMTHISSFDLTQSPSLPNTHWYMRACGGSMAVSIGGVHSKADVYMWRAMSAPWMSGRLYSSGTADGSIWYSAAAFCFSCHSRYML